MGFFSKILGVASSVLPFVGGGAGATVAKAAGAALGAYGAASSAQQTAQLNQQNYQLAYDQLHSQHQIEVADLKAAGLNPILSANSGNTTFSPSYQQPTTAAEKAAQMAGSAAQIGLMASEARKNEADARLSEGNYSLIDAQRNSIIADTAYKNALAGAVPIHVDLERAMTLESKSRSALADQQKKTEVQRAIALENQNSVWKEQWQLQKREIIARIYAAYASGAMSYAMATQAYSQAVLNSALEGKVNVEAANEIARGEGIVFENELAKWKADDASFELSYKREHPYLTLGAAGVRDTGVGIGSGLSGAKSVVESFRYPWR